MNLGTVPLCHFCTTNLAVGYLVEQNEDGETAAYTACKACVEERMNNEQGDTP